MTGADTSVFVQWLDLGSSDGWRVGIKDSIDIQGYQTRAGCAALADVPPASRHAAVVQALLSGGCRIIGKTNMHELAYGVTGINQWTGTPHNPRYPGRVPGGSSSGSAVAVAAGLVDFAIGTDTGGSIRIPAACCGVYGLKPSFGRINRAGVHPARSSLDCVGPFAQDLNFIERAMQLIDPSFVTQPTPATLRIGEVQTTADTHIGAAVSSLLQGTACETATLHLDYLEEAFTAGLTIIGAENWEAFGHLVDSPALGDDVRTRLLASRSVTPLAVAEANLIRTKFCATIDRAFDQVDVLALPTLPAYPPTLEAAAQAGAALRLSSLVRPFNLSGHPALSMPLGALGDSPVSLQLIGRRGEDAALCAAARRILQATQSTPDSFHNAAGT